MNSVRLVNDLFGNIDIYLMDQILKGRFNNSRRILDAGCGEGRNLPFFVNEKFDVYGVDFNPMSIKMCRMQFKSVPRENFQVADLDKLPFADACFDAILSSAVLHFARSDSHFQAMWNELSRVTSAGGILFLRMASTWGIDNVSSSEFPFHVDDQLLQQTMLKEWNLLDPVKSVWVEGKRSMAVLILQRR
jgi:tellurite methyltransferase